MCKKKRMTKVGIGRNSLSGMSSNVDTTQNPIFRIGPWKLECMQMSHSAILHTNLRGQMTLLCNGPKKHRYVIVCKYVVPRKAHQRRLGWGGFYRQVMNGVPLSAMGYIFEICRGCEGRSPPKPLSWNWPDLKIKLHSCSQATDYNTWFTKPHRTRMY